MRNKINGRPYLQLIDKSVPNTLEYLQIGILEDKTQAVLKKVCAKDHNIPLGKIYIH